MRGQKLHLNDMYVVYISCFHSALRLETYVEGTYTLNLLLPHFIDNREKYKTLKILDRNVSSASFQRIYTGY